MNESAPLQEDEPATTAARSFVRRFAVTLTTCLVVVGAINVLVNPLAYYPGGLLRPLTWSTRVLREHDLHQCGDVRALIIGSSRSMKLPPSRVVEIEGKRAYNAAVDSAMPEDYLALLRIAHERCKSLDEVILGVDVESFHDHRAPDQRVTGSGVYWAHLPARERAASALGALQEALSLEQLQSSLKSLRLRAAGYPEATATFDADGFLHYTALERQMAAGSFKLDVDAIAPSYLLRFAGFEHPSPRRQAVFEQFLDEARADGVRVRAFITPMHAKLLARLRAERDFEARRTEVRAWLERMQRP